MKLFKIGCFAVAACFASNTNAQVKKIKQVPKMDHYFCNTMAPSKKGVPIDTSNTRAMADNYFLWDNGKTLNVKFINGGGSQKLRSKIMTAAKEWEKYANITFNFVDYGDAQIRINVSDRGGCNSVVGTVALSVSDNEKTMNLDSNFFYFRGEFYDVLLQGTVMHEFGHAIGLLHEHSYKGMIQWNRDVVYKEAKESNGWDKAQVDFQIFNQYNEIYTNGFQYDKYSIMHYGFPARWTLNNVEIRPNYSLSATDKATVALIYPKGTPRANEFPRFTLTDYSSTKVVKSEAKRGLLIYPSFNLSTAGRTGKIVLIAYLVSPDNKFVPSPANPNNAVAGIRSGDLKPGTKLSINKGIEDFEMFIPYSDFPPNFTNYKVFMQVFLFDDVTKEKKYLAQDLVVYSQIK